MSKEKTHDWLSTRRVEVPADSNVRARNPTSQSVLKVHREIAEREKAAFPAFIERLKGKAANSRAWLKGRGWELCDEGLALAPMWRKKGPPVQFSRDKNSTTASEKASMDLYTNAVFTVYYADAGQWPIALFYAYDAGRCTGLAQARRWQTEMKKPAGRVSGQKRGDKDEAELFAKLEMLRLKVGRSNFEELKTLQIEKSDPWFFINRAPRFGKAKLRRLISKFKKSV